MKTELFLDYQRILANQAVPVHFAVKFHAEDVVSARPQPAAFCVVLDRSGSMQGSVTLNPDKLSCSTSSP